jgi:hypothetical protein
MRLGVLARLIATMGRQFLRFVVLRCKVRFDPAIERTGERHTHTIEKTPVAA